MPKERFHILVADETLKRIESTGTQTFLSEEERLAYLLGSISPDVFFYDLPTFGFSRLGGCLHRFEGEVGAAFFKAWLREEGRSIPSDMRAWMMGFVSHLLTDAFWHPHIRAFSDPPSSICNGYRLSSRCCHHWLESELESHWLTLMGPPDRYASLLRRFWKTTHVKARYVSYFRKFLLRADFEEAPGEARIRRCLFWQVLLMRQFAHPLWANWRLWLLGKKKANYLGALIVPTHITAVQRAAPPLEVYRKAAHLFEPALMAKAISSLSSRLTELPVRS
jgi:hypothetical protein